MKKSLLFTIAVIFAFGLLSNKGGRNQATTGAPFENSNVACANCHSGGNYNPIISLTIKNSNNEVVTSYIPDSTYTLEMLINSATGNPSYYGFQSVIVGKDNKNAGEFGTLGDKVRKLTISNRSYLTQISPRPDGLYTAKWKAPNLDSVRMYISGLAANGNNGTGGDKGTFSSIKLSKGGLSGVFDPMLSKFKSLLTTNIISNEINFTEDVSNFEIYSLNGSYIKTNNHDVKQLNKGVYIIRYQHQSKVISEKIIKL